jgi:ornithine cyclodeaminase/alanine dehydrogenase-like protein (mu-crystallin family)
LKPGTHVTSIGAHTPDARELDEDLVKKAKIVIDSKDALKSGDLKGYKGHVVEIQEVLAGRKVHGDITLFKSVGTALQDVAMASLVYEKARNAGMGREL